MHILFVVVMLFLFDGGFDQDLYFTLAIKCNDFSRAWCYIPTDLAIK